MDLSAFRFLLASSGLVAQDQANMIYVCAEASQLGKSTLMSRDRPWVDWGWAWVWDWDLDCE